MGAAWVSLAVSNQALVSPCVQRIASTSFRPKAPGARPDTSCFSKLALQAATIAVMVLGARIPQIWMNFRRGNSGELSMLTYALQWSGNLVGYLKLFPSFEKRWGVGRGDFLYPFLSIALPILCNANECMGNIGNASLCINRRC